MYIEFDYVHVYLSYEIDEYFRERITTWLYEYKYGGDGEPGGVYAIITCLLNDQNHTIIEIENNLYKCIRCDKYCRPYRNIRYRICPMYRVDL